MVVLILFAIFGGSSEQSESATVGETQLTSITLYKGTGVGTDNKEQTSTFEQGDPIQVGLSYSGSNPSDTFKVEIVADGEEEPVYDTSQLRPNDSDGELFIDINRDNLAPGSYSVILRDKTLNEITRLSMTIVEGSGETQTEDQPADPAESEPAPSEEAPAEEAPAAEDPAAPADDTTTTDEEA